MALHAAYHVYYGSEMLVTGWREYDEFTIPQGAFSYTQAGTLAAASLALFLF